LRFRLFELAQGKLFQVAVGQRPILKERNRSGVMSGSGLNAKKLLELWLEEPIALF